MTYHIYSETKFSDRKRSGINVREYKHTIDPLPLCITLTVLFVIVVALVITGII